MKFLAVLLLFISTASYADEKLTEAKNLLETAFGSSARPYSTQDFGRGKYDEAISVIIPEKGHRKSLLYIREKLPAGLIAYIGTTRNLSADEIEGVELVVIESDNKLDILKASKTDGVNHNLSNEKIIKKIQSWDEKYTIDIWQAETDTIQLTFEKIPENMESFGREVYEFCPDIVNQGSGNISDIVMYIKAEKALYLWWD